jgi:hypothetical protein
MRYFHRNRSGITRGSCERILSNGREIFQRRERNPSNWRIGDETLLRETEEVGREKALVTCENGRPRDARALLAGSA